VRVDLEGRLGVARRPLHSDIGGVSPEFQRIPRIGRLDLSIEPYHESGIPVDIFKMRTKRPIHGLHALRIHGDALAGEDDDPPGLGKRRSASACSEEKGSGEGGQKESARRIHRFSRSGVDNSRISGLIGTLRGNARGTGLGSPGNLSEKITLAQKSTRSLLEGLGEVFVS